MAHQSDNATRLEIRTHSTSAGGLCDLITSEPDVWLMVLPYGRSINATMQGETWYKALREFAGRLNADSLVAVLTTPEDAAAILPEIHRELHFQLWVAVKLNEPRDPGVGRLPEHHAALLVMSKYRGSLRHTKTRIAYTFCPACDKTTKDYGGKKHTYHAYGTLMSDVWRDLGWNVAEGPTPIAERLADLFGLDPHHRLNVVSLVDDASLKPCGDDFSPSVMAAVADTGPPKLDSALLNGDCIAELATIADDSVDFCFADPPYNLAKRYDGYDDALDIVGYFEWCDRWLDEMARVLRPGRTCAVLNIPQWAVRHFLHMRKTLHYQNWIAWEGLSLPVRMIMPSHYSIICFSKGPPRALPGLQPQPNDMMAKDALAVLREFYCVRAACVQYRRANRIADRAAVTDLWWDVHRLKHNSNRVDHPCQLPPALMNRLIGLFTHPGEVVLDPFDGAGTTSLCAHMMGRRYLGIELSAKYHQLARQRHAMLDGGQDPFGKAPRVPKAKNNNVKRIGHTAYKVPKKVLQLEVRQIAGRLGRLPTRDDVTRLSKYPISYFDDYFLSWGEVCAAARHSGMSEDRHTTSKAISEADQTLFDLEAAR
jgi:hypothetical protein